MASKRRKARTSDRPGTVVERSAGGIMARTLTWNLFVSLILLAACARDDGGAPRSERRAGTAASAAASPDPCAVALTPHAGTDATDQDITRFQELARRATDRVPHVERLGWAFVVKARVSFDPGFYKLAEQSALCIEQTRPGSVEALLLRGHVLHAMHRFREGETLARELVTRRGLAFDHGLLGDLLLEQGKLPEALRAYQTMMDLKPGPQAYSRAAHLRWLKGDLAGAIELMQMAIGVSGFRDPEAAAWAHVRLALYEWQVGSPDKAAAHVARALALQPEYPPALLTRGRLLLAAGKPADAVAPVTRAARLNPVPEYQWAAIEVLRATRRGDEASTIERTLLETGAVTDRRTLALYLASTGRETDAAVRLAGEELEARADVFTLDALAWALSAAGRHREAYELTRRALAEGTQDARLFYHAGLIAAAAGEPREATRWLARATALQPMLFPSERARLAEAAAAARPATRARPALASAGANPQP